MKKYIAIIAVMMGVSVSCAMGAISTNSLYSFPGDPVKQDRSIQDFHALDVGGAFEVHLKQGSSESLVVEADADVVDKIITEVKDGVLKIYTEKGCCRNSGDMSIYLTFKELNSMEISGACDLENDGTLSFDKLKMEVSGASEIELKMSLDKLDLELSGASEIEFEGNCNDVYMDASGASEIDAEDFEVAKMIIDASGASEIKVFVTGELLIDGSGATSIRYKGSPKLTADKSGATSIKPM